MARRLLDILQILILVKEEVKTKLISVFEVEESFLPL